MSYLDYYPTLVTVAGAEVASNLVGESLVEIIEGGRNREASLAWELVAADRQTWSILSADGRWRLFQFYVGEPQLFDLQADSAGSEDVAAQYPAIVAGLRQQYAQWRNQQRLLALDYQQEDDSGRGLLTGLSLQRSPGYGGFGFSVELYPDSEAPPQSEQVIALQEQQWQLTYEGGRFAMKMHAETLRTDAIALEGCTHVLATAHFRYSARFSSRNQANISLFVNGELAAEAIIPDPTPGAGPFMAPTFVGQDANRERRFTGRLVAPRIYNDYLAAAHSGIIESGVEVLARNACTDSQHKSKGKR